MRKLAIFSLGFTLAAVAYIHTLSSVAALICGTVLVGIFVTCLFFTSDRVRRIRIFALGAAIGLFWTWGYEQIKILPMRSLAGEGQSLQAQVWDFPEETDYGCRAVCKTEKGKILLYLDCAADELAPGDRVSLKADVIDVSRGNGDDNNLYYQSRDISLLGLQRGELEIEKAEKTPLSAYPRFFTRRLQQSITEAFPEDAAGFALALVTGDRSGLSYAVQNDLSTTGISHVVSVSGMHVSLLAGMILFFCRNRRRLAAFISLVVMFFFVAMLGFIPSASRAVIMNAVLLLAPVLKRENDPLTSLSLALLLILCFNPWAVANISLQLSFSAMVGIFLLTPYFYKKLAEFLRLDEMRERGSVLLKPLRSTATVLATTFGATVATTPFSVNAFSSFSVISPVTNLLTMAVISFVFSAAFVTAIAGLIWQPLAQALGWILAWPIRYVLWVVDCLADVPYAAVYTEKVYIFAWVITAYLLLAVFYCWRKRCKPLYLLISLGITLVGAVLFSGMQTENMSLTAMDVGQGQCIAARSGGQTVLVDCGGDREDANGESVARKLLMSGETKVDAVILTHFDEDHTCGLIQLMQRMEVAKLYVPDIQQGEENRALVLKAAQEEGAEVCFVSLETELAFGRGRITLFPPTQTNAENASLSALLSFEEYDILITGDMSSDEERKLLRKYDFPDIEVLFAGHHGSKYSTSRELLEATMPETVLICVGENSYGHPAQEVLDRIAAIGAQVYRTDLHGDITITR